jgi:hypothetical protein
MFASFAWLPALAAPEPLERLSVEDQQTALDTLRQALDEQHPGLTLYTDRAALDAAFEATRAAFLPDATALDVWRDLLPLVALVGCTHTTLQPTESVRKGVGQAWFPLDLVVVDERLYVDPRAHPGPVRELVTVEGMPAEVLLDALRSRASSDGGDTAHRDVRVDEAGPALVTAVLGAHEVWRVVTRERDAEPRKETLAGVRWERWPEAPAPSARTFVDDTEAPVLVVPVREFAEGDSSSHRRVAALRRRAADVDAVVLDLRGNGGGRTQSLLDLWALFAWRPIRPYAIGWTRRADHGWPRALPEEMPAGTPPGVFGAAPEDLYPPIAPDPRPIRLPVVVVTDGTTISSASDLAYFFQFEGRGAIVGTETSSGRWSQNCEQYTYVVLPRVHLYVRIPIVTLATADVAGRGHGVVPRTVAAPTLDDLAAGTDPVLERAIVRARELLR